MDCSLPGSSVQGLLQARILEWVAISFSKRSSWPRDWAWVSCIVGRFFTTWATREALREFVTSISPAKLWKKNQKCMLTRREMEKTPDAEAWGCVTRTLPSRDSLGAASCLDGSSLKILPWNGWGRAAVAVSLQPAPVNVAEVANAAVRGASRPGQELRLSGTSHVMLGHSWGSRPHPFWSLASCQQPPACSPVTPASW